MNSATLLRLTIFMAASSLAAVADEASSSSTRQAADVAPAKPAPGGAPISTNTDRPAATPAPVAGVVGQTKSAQPNASSPTGAASNMAPVRGAKPAATPAVDPKSASGLTTPGASSGSSLGTGSNSTLKSTTEKTVPSSDAPAK